MNTKSIAVTLPSEITNSLTRAEIFCCDLILDLCRGTSRNKRSGTRPGPMYTCVSQAWLAKKVGVTREWISKCVNKLQRFGLLRITRRRKVGERWQTNLYRVGEALKKGWRSAKRAFLFVKSRVNFSTHIGIKNTISSTEGGKIAAEKPRQRRQLIFKKSDSMESLQNYLAGRHKFLDSLPD